MPRTPAGFCAVMHVIALVPCTPSAAKVFRSAWMPAPPPLSEPAMVSATGSCGRFDMGQSSPARDGWTPWQRPEYVN